MKYNAKYTYFIKICRMNELGSVKNKTPQRGRHLYISQDDKVSGFFPTLSRSNLNDNTVLTIIPLYKTKPERVYCNFHYHNSKYSTINHEKNGRNEYRIYLNRGLDENHLLQKEDILIFRMSEIERTENAESPEQVIGKIYYLYRCFDKNSNLYIQCKQELDSKNSVHGGYILYNGYLEEVEKKIVKINLNALSANIDDSLAKSIGSFNQTEMASLFNSSLFRDFVMKGYNNRCAITRTSITGGTFINLEAAHIWPKAQNGPYLPSNGIAMCRDMHWAFDKGMFTIDNNFCVKVHPKITSDFLIKWDKTQIELPQYDFFKPSLANLEYHQKNVYGIFQKVMPGQLSNS